MPTRLLPVVVLNVLTLNTLVLSWGRSTVINEIPEEASNGDSVRIISGSVLTGEKVEKDGHLGAYHIGLALIPEMNLDSCYLMDG